MDANLFAARRVGLGLRIGDDLPAPPREWAMDQVRSIPKLDFFDLDGTSLLPKLPPEAALLDYSQACLNFGAEAVAEDALLKKHAADEQEQFWQIFATYCDIPHWGAALAATLTAINGTSPVFERFWQFWFNHFVVSANDNHVQTLLSAHLQAIRAAMTGSFENLVMAAVGNPATIYYLDNVYSVGPHSKQAHGSTLNENLGRELLELYTVSPAAGYTQDDVIQAALILTGWTFSSGSKYKNQAAVYFPGAKPGPLFAPDRHEPGPRTVMGKTYPADNQGGQLRALVADLAVHPSTAKFISTKLARAFVADDPPQESIDRIAAVFTATKGDLIAVHSAVIDEALTVGPNFTKFTKPTIWLQQAHRTFGMLPSLRSPSPQHLKFGIRAIYKDLGEDFSSPAQPNGWPDTEPDWLSKAMLDRRVRYAYYQFSRVPDFTSEQVGDYVDRLAGRDSLLSTLVKRADTMGHATLLLLTSPQFLRI